MTLRTTYTLPTHLIDRIFIMLTSITRVVDPYHLIWFGSRFADPDWRKRIRIRLGIRPRPKIEENSNFFSSFFFNQKYDLCFLISLLFIYNNQKKWYMFKNNMIGILIILSFYLLSGFIPDPFHGFMKWIRIRPNDTDPTNYQLHYNMMGNEIVAWLLLSCPFDWRYVCISTPSMLPKQKRFCTTKYS